jgi:hypothetical protein
MNYLKLGAAGLALLLLGGCGRGEGNPDQPSAEERQKLDNVAARLDEEQTFDTSADSLVLNEGAAQVTPGNGQAPAAPAANGAATSTNASNSAAPR